MLCALVYVDDFMLACSDSTFGKLMSLRALTSCTNGKCESRVFKQCAAQITQAYNKTEYVKEISIITLPSHRRRQEIQNHTT